MLTEPQIQELADELDAQCDDAKLQLISTDLGINWANLTGGVQPFRERALKLVRHLKGAFPPRDGELLEMLRTRGNSQLKALAARLMAPNYFPPNGDPHNAILLGRTAFIARQKLRTAMRDFTTGANHLSTRVLVVRGNVPCGKTYTWEYLRHLALGVGAQPLRLRLQGRGESYSPRHLFEDVFGLLDIDAAALPPLPDGPQLARLEALLAAFKGKIVGLKRRSWLVIDDLNDVVVTQAVQEAAFAIAQAAEELKPQHLWVALLGYNTMIVDPELRFIAEDDPEFPTPNSVAQHLKAVSAAGPNPLQDARATEIAALLFQKHAALDKAAMIRLTVDVEKLGERLRAGQQP